jgi:hypothetical protein
MKMRKYVPSNAYRAEEVAFGCEFGGELAPLAAVLP